MVQNFTYAAHFRGVHFNFEKIKFQKLNHDVAQ